MIFCYMYMILVVITNMNMYVEKDYDMYRLEACVLILFVVYNNQPPTLLETAIYYRASY